MSDYINNHPIKIALGTVVICAIAVISFVYYAGSKINTWDSLAGQSEQIAKIPVIEQRVDGVEGDISEIKTSVKRIEDILLKRK